MPVIAPIRKNIFEEDVRFRASVSEAVGNKIGSSVNFINERQYDVKNFFINGNYGIMSAYPQLSVDGRCWFQNDAYITGILVYSDVPGSSGTTELDIKKSSDGGFSWASIFSTTPKFNSTASGLRHCVVDYVGATSVTPTGFTAPILITNNFNAGDVLRVDIIQKMAGTPQNCGILLHFRPR